MVKFVTETASLIKTNFDHKYMFRGKFCITESARRNIKAVLKYEMSKNCSLV